MILINSKDMKETRTRGKCDMFICKADCFTEYKYLSCVPGVDGKIHFPSTP